MAKYTIELRKVCQIYTREVVESWFKDYILEDYLLPEQIQQIEKFNIFSKDRLAKKIVDKYYMSEIGFETPFLFAHMVKITMQEIMEAKLPLIYTKCIEYDPLVNENYIENFKRTASGDATSSNTGTSTSNSNSDSSNLNVNSDTPQGQINKEAILNGTYASVVTAGENSSNMNDKTDITNIGNSNTSQQEDYTRTVKGNRGVLATMQILIKQYRDNIINIEKDIMEELQPCFMGLY